MSSANSSSAASASSLVFDAYGKSKVRVARVSRDGPRHSVTEMSVDVSLQGDFQRSYYNGDNTKTVPTDTIKNTVFALAKMHPVCPIEQFGRSATRHFLDMYPQVSRATVVMRQVTWVRMRLAKDGGREHDFAFVKQEPETRVATVVQSRGAAPTVTSSIEGLTLLKTHGSAFENFPRCRFTTLADASDRMLSTSVTCRWTYNTLDVDYNDVYRRVRERTLELFATKHSKSVQQLIYDIGTAAVADIPQLETVYFQLPNIHYLKYDIERFGLENPDEVFIATSEPHGNIEGTIARARPKL